jgi:GDPmannose 4,6-dehydratase
MSRTVIVTGAAGQDGSYLTERLLAEGSTVHAVVRRTDAPAVPREAGGSDRLTLHVLDVRETGKLAALVRQVRPDEVFNLAGLSSVAASFDRPSETWQSNADAVVGILEAIRRSAPESVLYQASSSEMYGVADGADVVVSEESPLAPVSPYGAAKAAAHVVCGAYRSGFGLRIACGILFNHESHRRGQGFLTRKVADHVRHVSSLPASERAKHDPLRVGNLAARRDWGFAPEYVDGILRIARQTECRVTAANPVTSSVDGYRDYVLATGMARNVWELIDCAFERAGLHIQWDRTSADPFEWTARYADVGTLAVVSDVSLRRVADPGAIVGDASRATNELGWTPSRDLGILVSDLLSSAGRR